MVLESTVCELCQSDDSFFGSQSGLGRCCADVNPYN
jgi:hypothetical protein